MALLLTQHIGYQYTILCITKKYICIYSMCLYLGHKDCCAHNSYTLGTRTASPVHVLCILLGSY